jgi:hypothetical protein
VDDFFWSHVLYKVKEEFYVPWKLHCEHDLSLSQNINMALILSLFFVSSICLLIIVSRNFFGIPRDRDMNGSLMVLVLKGSFDIRKYSGVQVSCKSIKTYKY